jgi:hypothetical protein
MNPALSETAIGTWQHLLNVFAGVILPCAIIVAVVWVPTLIVGRVCRVKAKGFGVATFAAALLGLVVGLFTGASTTPVIGDVLPALLTFISAMLAYLFAKDALKEYRDAIPPALINLLLTALISAFLGSAIRSDKEAFERNYKHWALEQEKVDFEIKRLQACKILDLPCAPRAEAVAERGANRKSP